MGLLVTASTVHVMLMNVGLGQDAAPWLGSCPGWSQESDSNGNDVLLNEEAGVRRRENKEREIRKEEECSWRDGEDGEQEGYGRKKMMEEMQNRGTERCDRKDSVAEGRSEVGEREVQLWSWLSYPVVQLTKAVSTLCHWAKISSHGKEGGSF
ncbi:hypothetical protein AAES_110872 [Amazona aestiva]|uniref:Uncharacterized protein n=1 Tax=Amazona aestiva TaxID=12930 RepID=A0A0Q3URW9_AMAAE|nr:hypothetical protein AAES_110872 [Amazona aestiva]